MFADDIHASMRHATYEILVDGTFYGSIPGFQGVWADGATLEACREELSEGLEGWILLRIADHLDLPEIGGQQILASASV